MKEFLYSVAVVAVLVVIVLILWQTGIIFQA